MQNSQTDVSDHQHGIRKVILRFLLFLANVTELATRASVDPSTTVKLRNNQIVVKMMKRICFHLMLMFIAASEVRAWTKYGGDSSCKTILANDTDEAFSERAKGWTFGYISALNEIMQQQFATPPEDELIWQAVKKFCEDNQDASHYVASATIYVELLKDQGGPQ